MYISYHVSHKLVPLHFRWIPGYNLYWCNLIAPPRTHFHFPHKASPLWLWKFDFLFSFIYVLISLFIYPFFAWLRSYRVSCSVPGICNVIVCTFVSVLTNDRTISHYCKAVNEAPREAAMDFVLCVTQTICRPLDSSLTILDLKLLKGWPSNILGEHYSRSCGF